jgi:hypothetical protein
VRAAARHCELDREAAARDAAGTCLPSIVALIELGSTPDAASVTASRTLSGPRLRG